MSKHSHHWTEADYYAFLARNSHAADAVMATPASPLPEKTMLAHLRAVAKRLGLLCYHTWRSKKSEEGFPDLIIVDTRPIAVPPTLYALELKSAEGDTTASQEAWLDQLALVTRVEVGVVRPADLPTWLARLGGTP